MKFDELPCLALGDWSTITFRHFDVDGHVVITKPMREPAFGFCCHDETSRQIRHIVAVLSSLPRILWGFEEGFKAFFIGVPFFHDFHPRCKSLHEETYNEDEIPE
jgi:hypothetical protein